MSTSAVLSGLYAHLPSNGSELVLFDVNRNVKFGPLDPSGGRRTRSRAGRPVSETTDWRRDKCWRRNGEAVERVVEAGDTTERTRPLGAGLSQRGFFAVACRAAVSDHDSLYGLTPDQSENFGVNLGAWPRVANAER